MKKDNIFFELPKQLKEDLLKINFGTKIRTDKALRFIHILINKAKYDNFDTLKYQELNAEKYIKKYFGKKYNTDFLKLLVKNNILQTKKVKFKEKEGTTLVLYKTLYRIDENYFNCSEEYRSISYTDNRIKDNHIKIYRSNRLDNTNNNCSSIINENIPSYPHPFRDDLETIDNGSNTTDIEYIHQERIRNMVYSLNINYVEIMNRTREVISSIDGSKFKVDNQVEEEAFELYNRIDGIYFSWINKSTVLNYCKDHGLSLIQDGKYFYVDNLDRYIETKKRNVYFSYHSTMEALRSGAFYAKRNNTNFRLDTTFTSMSKQILRVIKRDNGLIEMDMVNSQYAILANWLMKEHCYQYEDVKLFCKLAIEGGLYEYVMEKFNPEIKLSALTEEEFDELRDKTKEKMMSVFFSSYQSMTKNKKKFNDLFPNIAIFVYDFKRRETVEFKKALTKDELKDESLKKDRSKCFSIKLQKMESTIFIDGLMAVLLRQGLFVLTKHDSIIIRKSDEEAIYKMVLEYFKSIDFKVSIRIDKHVVHTEILDTPIQSETIPAIDNVKQETGADNEEINSVYKSIFQKFEKEYKLTQEMKDRKMDYNSIIALEHMSDKYKPAKELLELIRA